MVSGFSIKILNPLSIINLTVELIELEKGLKSKDDKREYFQKIRENIERIKNEVRMLRDFRIA